MKLVVQANLDDVGSEVIAMIKPLASNEEEAIVIRKIQMVIVSPKGKMILFDRSYISPDTQCEAIRAFMEEHKYD